MTDSIEEEKKGVYKSVVHSLGEESMFHLLGNYLYHLLLIYKISKQDNYLVIVPRIYSRRIQEVWENSGNDFNRITINIEIKIQKAQNGCTPW